MAVLIKNNIPVPSGCVYNIPDSIEYTKVFRECIFLLKTPYILRSSFLVEDGVFLSFAGIFESIQNVYSEEEFELAIEKIKKSVNQDKVKSYASYYNIDLLTLKPIVLIQEFKKSLISWVVFSEHPTDKNLLLIEYSKEIEGVTSGCGKTKQIIINKKSQKIVKGLDSKEFNEKNIFELYKYSLEIEKIFGRPQDIEWLFDGKKIWILQSRDITTSHQSVFIKEELGRLRKTFNEPSWITFTRKLFTEEVEYMTPLTLSLFRRFYSKNGPLGAVMKKLFIPVKNFDETKYIVDIFSRPYINETLEKEVFYIDYREGATKTLTSAIKKTCIKPFSFIKITLDLFRAIFSQTILRIQLFISFKRLNILLAHILSDIKKTQEIKSFSVQEKIEEMLKTIENIIVPKLFLFSIFQDYLYTLLQRRMKKDISDDDWNNFISIWWKITSIHYHYQKNAFELSSNRENSEAKNEISKVKDTNREIILERYQDLWTRHILSLYTDMYDDFSIAREVLHNEIVKVFNQLHIELLNLDREYNLYNSIWFIEIDELFKKSFPDKHELFKRKKRSEYLRSIVLPSAIRLKKWENLTDNTSNNFDFKDTINGEVLSSGLAHGRVGTQEMIKNGEKVEILLTENIDPSIVTLYPKIKGVITCTGGELSHAAILAREFSIPMLKIINYPRRIIGMTVLINTKNKEIVVG